MQGRVLLLAALIAAGSGLAAAAEGSGNSANDALLAMPPDQQAQTLAKVTGKKCVGESAFPMGVTATGKGKGFAYWSVRCADGTSFAIQVPPKPKAPWGATDCRNLQGTSGECFKKF